jgi:hypothetical protein
LCENIFDTIKKKKKKKTEEKKFCDESAKS